MISTLSPPSIPQRVLEDFAQRAYGLTGQWSRLEGERDQNFRVKQTGGHTWVFKVCHPDEGDAVLACQAEALQHIAIADESLPVPRLKRSLMAEALPRLHHEGRDYPVMLLSWLDGDVIGETALSPGAMRDMGKLLARLGLAMRGFVHGAPATRGLVWDTRHVLKLHPQIANLAAEDRPLAEEILGRHAEVTEPAMRRMRSQIIHGDVHPYNSLIDAEGQISGIIDFGDIVHGALALDLANAAGDFLAPGHDNEAMLFELVKGYCAVTPLEEQEADALLDLIEVRLLMTPLVDALKASNGIASQGYFQAFNGRSMPMIRELRTIGHEHLRNLIRRAAAFPPKKPETSEKFDEIVARRRHVMGEKLYVFYDPPIHMVKGEGVWLTASDGKRYLDCYNNVPHVGHCHPYVTEAIARQARTLNTNTRYITDQPIEYAERLGALCSDGLTAVVFVNSGSEANDLAWRMAKAWTGKQGGLAMEFAYHGVSESIDAFSPSNSPANWYAPHIRLLPSPDVYRGAYGANDPDIGERYAAMADPLIADLDGEGYGVAALMIDSAFMTNGILDAPKGYVQGIVERVHKAGGTFIADEVQSGFGRMGTEFWGHRHHGVVPDFITIGKPAGNGHPVGAVITRPEILEHFIKLGPFFSTFGGNNVACAAGIAVLDVIRDEGLVENARVTGDYLRGGFRKLMREHPIIGDVRGIGLATGVELVRDRTTKEPAAAETTRLLGLLRDEGILIGGEGVLANVLKIRPPIVFSKAHADIAVAAMDRALSRL
jgi:4-aminobutyrate aminotransferase-like enzyme/Ser/Thr protein kinase RdoA (MazF antagonist)